MVIQSREKQKSSSGWNRALGSKQALVWAGEALSHAEDVDFQYVPFPVSFVGLIAFSALPSLSSVPLLQLSGQTHLREKGKVVPTNHHQGKRWQDFPTHAPAV